jgi:sigma-B regulation protein RsbU (phosphoserine phosphatase)
MTPQKTDTLNWLDETCTRFTEATGWPMRFERTAVRARIASEPAGSAENEDCWSRDLSNGENVLGNLRLDLPARPESDQTFTTIWRMADVVGDLCNRLAAAELGLVERSEEFATLIDVGMTVPQNEDLQSALTRLLQASCRLTGFRSAAFFLLDPSNRELKLRVGHRVDVSKFPFSVRPLDSRPPDFQALSTNQAVLWSAKDDYETQWLPPDCSTAICVPVKSAAGPIGTLWLCDRRFREPGQREIHVLESIAAQITIVLERAVLLRESEVQHRQQRDLDVASSSQTQDILGGLTGNVGFDAAAVCSSRFELGGDLCELIPIDVNRTIVSVGDASGDSVPAAMVMSSVRGALRTLAMNGLGNLLHTDQVVQRINTTLHSITPTHQFMSLLFGVFNSRELTLTYTNAGHPTPLLIRDGLLTSFESHGMLLGVLPEATYERSVVQLLPGDVLVLFSDGISEAMSQRRQMFRSEGIYQALAGDWDLPAQQILDRILVRLDAHTSGGETDDRTLLVLKLPK